MVTYIQHQTQNVRTLWQFMLTCRTIVNRRNHARKKFVSPSTKHWYHMSDALTLRAKALFSINLAKALRVADQLTAQIGTTMLEQYLLSTSTFIVQVSYNIVAIISILIYIFIHVDMIKIYCICFS